MLRTATRSLLVEGLKLWVQRKYERYGRMLNLNIDSNSKEMRAEIMLKGEAAPISIIARYAVSPDAKSVRLSGITTSREWINAILAETGKTSLELPLSGIAGSLAGQLL